MWDHITAGYFNWLWYDVHTYERYTAEMTINVKTKTRKGGSKGVKDVLVSLPQNSRTIFKLLAEMQMASLKEGKRAGVVGMDVSVRGVVGNATVVGFLRAETGDTMF